MMVRGREQFGREGVQPRAGLPFFVFALRPNLHTMQRMRLLLPLLIAISLVGCGSGNDLMPMQSGSSWTYTTFNGFETYFEPVKVVRRIAVGGSDGFELQGPLGICRLAWSGKRLIGEQLGSVRFDPPITLLAPGLKTAIPWSGSVMRLTGTVEGQAELTQADESITVGTQAFKTTKTTLILTAKGQKIELVTWFSPGYGIVRQEQHTDGRLNLSLERISGPS
jgi:hypothetical protein